MGGKKFYKPELKRKRKGRRERKRNKKGKKGKEKKENGKKGKGKKKDGFWPTQENKQNLFWEKLIFFPRISNINA